MISSDQFDRQLQAGQILEAANTIDSLAAFDDDIDLSLDENAVEWEEWIEAESPPIQIGGISQNANITNWSEDWDLQFPSPPRNVKPLNSRGIKKSASIDPSEHWGKFSPEYVGIYVNPKPSSANYHHDPLDRD